MELEFIIIFSDIKFFDDFKFFFLYLYSNLIFKNN